MTKENLEKAAYSAVGAPVAGAKALRARAEKLAESVRRTRDDLKGDVVDEFEEWVLEGEMVVDRIVEWLRAAGADSEIRSARKTAADQVRKGVADLSDRIDDALDLIEPEIGLRQIRGIGPANAEKLSAAGIPGIATFLDRTRTDEDTARLAEDTGIAAESLDTWRNRADLSRVDGIGDGYQRMLHAAGIGTLAHLANAEATELTRAIESMDRPGLPRQSPGRSEVEGWITEAGRLSLR